MKKFEYEILDLTGLSLEVIQSLLNEWGLLGWEVQTIITGTSIIPGGRDFSGSYDNIYSSQYGVLLKREIQTD